MFARMVLSFRCVKGIMKLHMQGVHILFTVLLDLTELRFLAQLLRLKKELLQQ